MTRNTGTDHKSTTARTVAKVAIAGMVVGAPLAMFATPASAAGGNNWDAVAQCESGGQWNTNTGNGFSGGLQFTPSTWAANGGQGSPQNASKSQQIQVAESVLATQGAGAWPVCGKALGSSSASSSPASSSSASNSSSSNTTPKATTYSAPKHSASNGTSQSTSTQSTSQSSKQSSSTQYAPKHAAPAASSTPKAGADYTVKSGDTLSKIAQNQGVQGGYQALFNLNSDTVSDPNMIFVGQQLALR